MGQNISQMRAHSITPFSCLHIVDFQFINLFWCQTSQLGMCEMFGCWEDAFTVWARAHISLSETLLICGFWKSFFIFFAGRIGPFIWVLIGFFVFSAREFKLMLLLCHSHTALYTVMHACRKVRKVDGFGKA